MKHVIFTFSFLLITSVGLAQKKPATPNGNERTNHNITRSNKTNAVHQNDQNGDNAVIDKRKCTVKGTYYWNNKNACDKAISQPKPKPSSGKPVKINNRTEG